MIRRAPRWLGLDLSENQGSRLVLVSFFRRQQKMSGAGSFTLNAAAIAAVVLAISPSPVRTASAQQLNDIKPMATSEPVAVYITLCLWSQHRPAEMCREVPLTPGAGGPGFASMEACQDGQEEAVRNWRAEAGPVFGFTAMAGDGYRIERVRCSLVMGN
jgi:hypothetical protein